MADKRRKIVDPKSAERRRAWALRIGALVVLVVIVAGIATWLTLSHESSTGSGDSPSVATDGGYRISKAAGAQTPVTVTVIEDFQCPACKAFETQFADAIKQVRANPKVAIDYKPIAFLDQMSTNQYSTRSANASACVAQSTAGGGNWDTWLKFHDLLYSNQPEENSAGLSDDELASLAQQAGAKNVKQCVTGHQFGDWVTSNTKKVMSSGVQATPTIRINGKDYKPTTPDDFLNAVNQAADAGKQ